MLLLIEFVFFAATAIEVSQTDFPRAMDDAMMRMHEAMHVPYSGNADRDFAAMMIPHHQGAIDMAKLELQYGTDERLRRLAQGIIVEQAQEIGVMHGILDTLTAPLLKPSDPQSRTHQ